MGTCYDLNGAVRVRSFYVFLIFPEVLMSVNLIN